jgi:hypothetical protein
MTNATNINATIDLREPKLDSSIEHVSADDGRNKTPQWVAAIGDAIDHAASFDLASLEQIGSSTRWPSDTAHAKPNARAMSRAHASLE